MSEPWTITTAAQALAAGEVSSRDLTVEAIARARAVDAELRCFIAIDEDAALRTAEARDAARGRGAGPLAGIPFAAKDIFVRAGVPPTVGARDVRLRFRGATSAALERLDAAGAVPIGSLSLDQFGYAATGMNPDFGDARNPWDTTRVAGGSSSGAAAAVAAGILPYALGSDTGGSVRIPASFCGVVGLKPTFGRVSKSGAAPLCWSQDTLGIVARTARDAALVLTGIAGHDPDDPASIDVPVDDYAAALGDGDLTGVRIGVDQRLFAGHDDVHALATDALDVLEGLGARVVDVDLGRLSAYDTAATVLTWAEVGALHEPTFRARPDAYAAATRVRLETALLSYGPDHVNAMRLQGRALAEFLDGVLAHVDVVATPATLRPPAEIAALRAADDGELAAASLDALRLNRPFSFLGVPAMSVPMGFDARDLPVGLQLAAGPWREARLLRCADAYQQATAWHTRVAADLSTRGRAA